MATMLNQSKEIDYEGGKLTLPIYLDYQASTPLDKRVLQAMATIWENCPGNPHSVSHPFGHQLRQYIEKVRTEIAALINARPEEIVFTSGATEANNLALTGHLKTYSKPRHVISVVTEHESILQPLQSLKAAGVGVTLLPVEHDGSLDLDRLKSAMRPDTALVTVMAANNETGICHDLESIGEICKIRNITFHTDAAQALSLKKIDVIRNHLTLLSLSGHKLYGPVGIGALYVKSGTALAPLMLGGNQQKGLRPGTLPAPLCAGLGTACRIAGESREVDFTHIKNLRHRFINSMSRGLGDKVVFNESALRQLPGCLSMTFSDIDAEDIIFEVPEIAVSTASACTSLEGTPSHVLLAMGRTLAEASGTIRIGFGRGTTALDVMFAAEKLIAAYRKLSDNSGQLPNSVRGNA
jgi:cysteine desulfurase